MAGIPGQLVPSTLVKLILSAKNVQDKDFFSKSDPICVVYKQDSKTKGWREIGRTEAVMNNLSPEWAKTVTLEYFFEERQTLKFEVYDVDSNSRNLEDHDFLGRAECDLAEIVSAGTFMKELTGLRGYCGKICVTSEELDDGMRECVQFEASGEKLDKKDFFGKSDPYLSIYRRNDDGSRTLVHRTEFIKKTLNPIWKRFEIDKRSLCGGDGRRTVVFECWDDDVVSTHDYIGGCSIVVDELLSNKVTTLELINEKKKMKKKKYKNSGRIQLRTCVVPQYTFLDFISGGTQLDFSVAIDFTASNGAPHLRDSLHYINQATPNQYEVAIRSVLEVCQYYNNSKIFDAFGFGAVIPPSSKMTPLFDIKNPQNVLSDPSVIGVDGVLTTYRDCLSRVQLFGPTNFAPVIQEVARRTTAKMKVPGARYQILLIITDGAICDMAWTKKAIVEASSLPLSIIIVGVGNANFEAMDELDGDDIRVSYNGRYAERDIVQFVPLNKFLGGYHTNSVEHERIMGMLAKEVLAEVPLQLTSFMKSRNIQPRPADNPFPKDQCAAALPPLRTDPSHPGYPQLMQSSHVQSVPSCYIQPPHAQFQAGPSAPAIA